MSDKNFRFNAEARDSILAGLNLLANTVKTTMGPGGRNVIIDGPLAGRPRPRTTKDGVTVARAVRVTEHYQRIGAEIAKDAAEKQNEEVGDGTTTVTVLTQAIVREGCKAIAAGFNPMDLRRGVDIAASILADTVQEMAREVAVTDETVYDVALVSANGDGEVALHISDALKQVGKGGVLTIEESVTGQMETELVQGMMFDRGYAYPIFINKPNYTCEANDPLILIVNGKISRLADITPLLEECATAGRFLLLIADAFEDAVMQCLAANKTGGGLQSCPVRTPSYGTLKDEILQDIATMTGTQPLSINSEIALADMRMEHCGNARKVVIKNNCTVIVEGKGDETAIAERLAFLTDQKEKAKSADERKNFELRLAGMTGGIAVIKVGGATDVEVKERKDRVDDAIHATKAALKAGIVIGGGMALAYAVRDLDGIHGDNDDQNAGIDIVRRIALEPMRQIILNAGGEPATILAMIAQHNAGPMPGSTANVLHNLLKPGDFPSYGYNAQTEQYGDMFEMGIIDPASVVKASITNAASVGGLLLTTEAILADVPKETKDGA